LINIECYLRKDLLILRKSGTIEVTLLLKAFVNMFIKIRNRIYPLDRFNYVTTNWRLYLQIA